MSGRKGGFPVTRFVLLSIISCSLFLQTAQALACGGLFCDRNTTVQIPPAQSAERLVFVTNARGHSAPPEALVEVGYSEDDPEQGTVQPYSGASIDTYIEIAYTGAVDDFAWIVPLLEKPVLIGTASPEIFNDLDQATAPRFTFTYASGSSTVSSGGGGMGCGGGMAMSAGGDGDAAYDGDGMETEPEVTLLDQQHVGPYEVVIIEAESAADLRDWLLQHDYEIPEIAEPVLQTYVDEGKKFAAFRLSDGEGVGAIEPVVLRLPGNEPCIPLRLTPVASEPVVTVSAIILGGGVTRPVNFSDTAMDPNAIRPTSPFTSDYGDRLRDAARGLGGRAVETEYAQPSGAVEATSPISQMMLQRSAWVTRLSTRIAPEEMTDDPIFEVTSGTTATSRDHVIDVTNDLAAQQALGVAPAASASSGGGSRRSRSGCAAVTGRPMHSVWLLGGVAGLLALRRIRRRRSI